MALGAGMVGDPLEADTRVGPLVVGRTSSRRSGSTSRSPATRGARCAAAAAGPTGSATATYVQPTVGDGPAAGSRVAREEIFGPVAAVLPAESYDDALALANDTPYGLSAACSQTTCRARSPSPEHPRGIVKINQESAGLEFQVPFGGMQESSSGSREQGKRRATSSPSGRRSTSTSANEPDSRSRRRMTRRRST